MKKNTKKFVAFLLCLTLIVSMSISAFAVNADEEPYKDPEEESRVVVTPMDGTWLTLVYHTGVNFRQQPKDNSDLWGTLYYGDTVYIVHYIFKYDGPHVWAQIRFNGHTGYVDNRFLG